MILPCWAGSHLAKAARVLPPLNIRLWRLWRCSCCHRISDRGIAAFGSPECILTTTLGHQGRGSRPASWR
jgi:hypothetical protein